MNATSKIGPEAEDAVEIADLHSEINRLQAEIHRLQDEREVAARAALGIGRFGTRVVIGRDLNGAIQKWLDAKSIRDPLPMPATADVVAAIVRRWFRVGLWHLMLSLGGAFTAGILIWQGLPIRAQIDKQQIQNELMRAQVKQQRVRAEQQWADSLIVRRAQLLATIYEAECGEDDDPESCRPRAKSRARKEALLAFVELERSRGVAADLRRSDFRRMDLENARFSGVDFSGGSLFSGAHFSGADLADAILTEVDFRGASIARTKLTKANLANSDLRNVNFLDSDLTEVNLEIADLSDAFLWGAKLSGAFLWYTDFSRVNFERTDLRDTDLSRAVGLTLDQLAAACGSETTILPEGMKTPETWPCEEQAPPSG